MIEMLDPEDIIKNTQRKYIFLSVKYDGNTIFVPLRSVLPNLSNALIGFPVPSTERPNAGLDYRKALIINDLDYILMPTENTIPSSQQKILDANYETIEAQVIQYIKGYKKAALKNRHHKDCKFKFSTLHNFHKELNISV